MKYSRDVYSKVHMVVIAKLTFPAPPEVDFKYDRYPNGGAERIQSGDGEEYARKDGKTWLKSNDWGDTGEPVDEVTARRLNNWLSVIDSRLNSDRPLKFVKTENAGDRDEFVFDETSKTKGAAPRFVFGRYKSSKDDKPPILDRFTGPMQLGSHEATVDTKFSYLIAVKMTEVLDASSPSPSTTASDAPARSASTGGGAVSLLDGKLTLDVPPDFARDPDDPKEPKTLAKFSHRGEGGAWGTVLRGTHGMKPEEVDGYMKKRVAEYSRGFNLPKDAHLQWTRKEMVTINGWKWADWGFVPMLKGKKIIGTARFTRET